MDNDRSAIILLAARQNRSQSWSKTDRVKFCQSVCIQAPLSDVIKIIINLTFYNLKCRHRMLKISLVKLFLASCRVQIHWKSWTSVQIFWTLVVRNAHCILLSCVRVAYIMNSHYTCIYCPATRTPNSSLREDICSILTIHSPIILSNGSNIWVCLSQQTITVLVDQWRYVVNDGLVWTSGEVKRIKLT
jgi:hypothetical protein